jgi:DNA polymerase-1
MNALEREIYEAAGVEFNINSPKQLAEILFDKMGIKPVKKTKTGFSTDESVLTILSEKHALPAKVLAYRQLSKLKGTYVDGLISLIDPVTGRVHTSLNQTVTTTGRLSSSRPNLQNIPVRGEYAARIREAFVPEEGFEFLSADYSQIELRLVAHMSADPALVRAFNEGEDIHSATASEVFGVIPALVTPELRRRAKAINFGIIYGMGSYGLSAELGISAREAAEYIDGYFAHYGTVKEFIDETIRSATKLGYTTTLFGRKRFIPELKNPVEQTRRFGERMAVNTPIQGTAADMIKAAMIRIDADLRAGGFKSRMLLQIHDELLFEFLPDEKDALLSVVKSGMEGVITLKVPVIVNVKTGRDWSRVD